MKMKAKVQKKLAEIQKKYFEFKKKETSIKSKHLILNQDEIARQLKELRREFKNYMLYTATEQMLELLDEAKDHAIKYFSPDPSPEYQQQLANALKVAEMREDITESEWDILTAPFKADANAMGALSKVVTVDGSTVFCEASYHLKETLKLIDKMKISVKESFKDDGAIELLATGKDFGFNLERFNEDFVVIEDQVVDSGAISISGV